MAAILLTILSGVVGKSFAQSSEDLAKQFDDFTKKQQTEFAQFGDDTQKDINDYIQNNFKDSEKTDTSKDNLEKVKNKIPDKAYSQTDLKDVSKDSLSNAKIINQGEEEKTVHISPEVINNITDSIINEDADSLSKLLNLPFSITVKSFDYRTDASKIEDAEARNLAIATKAVFSNAYFKTYKNVNKDIGTKINKDLKEKIQSKYSGANLRQLLEKAFMKKLVSDGVLKTIQQNPDLKDDVVKSLLQCADEIAVSILSN